MRPFSQDCVGMYRLCLTGAGQMLPLLFFFNALCLVTSHNSQHRFVQFKPAQGSNRPEQLTTPVWVCRTFKGSIHPNNTIKKNMFTQIPVIPYSPADETHCIGVFPIHFLMI